MILLTDQFDEELKLIKKAMQTADCDMSVVRAWLKLYEKVKKQTAATKDSYIQARANLEEIQKYVAKLEQVVVEEEWQSSRCKEEVAAITGQLRQMVYSLQLIFLLVSCTACVLLVIRYPVLFFISLLRRLMLMR